MTKKGLRDLRRRSFGRKGKALADLSDVELEEELVRRRRARANRPPAEGARGTAPHARYAPGSPQRKQIMQYYANLELTPGAPLEDVRRAYRELMRRYHPDKHSDDPERHRAATELAQSLTQAYRALTEHLSKRDE